MVENNDIVKIKDSDYDGAFRVVSATNLTQLSEGNEFSLVSILEPLDRNSFLSFCKEVHGFNDEITTVAAKPEQLEVITQDTIDCACEELGSTCCVCEDEE
jgi:hypothetical protein